VGPRFIAVSVSVFLVVSICLGGIGYAITLLAVPKPRDMFRGPGFEFQLAEGWWCELDGTEYICSPPGNTPRAAISIIAAKIRNKEDNLKAYEEHLRQQQPLTQKGQDAELSQIGFVRRREIHGQTWIEARHTSSEVKNFDTYYLATNTSFIGILVTLSVHQSQADKYIAQLNQMIETLEIYQR
jgi:hypothetical protein